jgi:hypothetical protein
MSSVSVRVISLIVVVRIAVTVEYTGSAIVPMLRIDEQYRSPSSPMRSRLETSLRALQPGNGATVAVLARPGRTRLMRAMM